MPGEAQSISTKVKAKGYNPHSRVGQPLTLGRITEAIKLLELDEYTEKGLIEMASRYPNQALPHFKRNFNLMIQRVRQKRKEEQRGELQDGSTNEEENSLEKRNLEDAKIQGEGDNVEEQEVSSDGAAVEESLSDSADDGIVEI